MLAGEKYVIFWGAAEYIFTVDYVFPIMITNLNLRILK
jgi:hypothetical protein